MLNFISLRLFCNCQFILPNPFTVFTSPTPAPLATIHLFSVSMSLFVSLFCSLDSTYKWNHMAFFTVRLILLSIKPPTFIHAVTNVRFHFLCPNNIPLYICTTAVLSTCLLMDLGLLPYLGYCNNAAMNKGVYISFSKNILLLFKYSCLHFTPTTPHPTPAKLISLPCFHPRPWFCSCVLYSCSWKLFPSLSPPNSPLVIVKLFLISMSLVIYCLIFSFVDYVPVKGEITWYFSLTSWLISLSITLSSSIHAKGRSSFFLSAV